MYRLAFRRSKHDLLQLTRIADHRQQQQRLSTYAGRLAGKIAVITGAASGVGKVTAAEFVANGAKVVLADIQAELGQALASELGPAATFIRCDVTEESQVAAAVDLAVSEHGHLDVMYNNAGIFGSVVPTFADLDLTDFDRTVAVNVRAVVAGIKHAARVMVPRRAGCILCTGSISGILGGMMAPHDYSISKSAVLGAVRTAAAELSAHGIRVNSISPHAMVTPMVMNAMPAIFPGVGEQQLVEIFQSIGELEGAICEPIDVAKAAVYLASDDAKYVSGHNLVVDGGFTSTRRLQIPPP